MKQVTEKTFDPNLNFTEIVMRYYLLMALGITAGVLGLPGLMVLVIPIFWTGILGWCPIYHVLGINHHEQKMAK